MTRQIAAEECPRADGMPTVGLGTWQNSDPEQCAESVERALELGYRHVDTAQAYGNEAAVGEGIERASVDRDEVFLATKVWIDDLAGDDVIETTRESIDRLGVDYLDLLYVHWPSRTYDAAETLAAFDELHESGAIDRVGVSNFEPEHVDEAVELSEAGIFANQVEMHPLLPQRELREHCAAHDIEVVAYSPLARGRVFDLPEVREVAERHDASAARVALSWLREKGVTAIPKATGEDHLRDNLASLSLELDDEDVELIDGVETVDRQVDPGFAPW